MSRKRNALAAFYLGVCFDKKNNIRDAMYYYKRFLKLKPKDEKREVLVRTRMKVLKQDPDYVKKKKATRFGLMSMMRARLQMR